MEFKIEMINVSPKIDVEIDRHWIRSGSALNV